MAITPRTIFSSPGPATVAAVSLLAVTAVGTAAYMTSVECDRSSQIRSKQASGASSPCERVRAKLGNDQSQWSEAAWVGYSKCFAVRGNSLLAIRAAQNGLEHYPRSSSLYHVAGLHQIISDRHAEAVDTLQEATRRLDSTPAGIENNLAWASLWAPREMPLHEARTMYRRALDDEPRDCNILNTGLWVEYAISRETSGAQKFEALDRFGALRGKYQRCVNRFDRGNWDRTTEMAGVATMFAEVESRHGLEVSDGLTSGEALLDKTARKMKTSYPNVSLDKLCNDSVPISAVHHKCKQQVGEAVESLTSKKKNTQGMKRNGREGCGSAGGGGRPARTY